MSRSVIKKLIAPRLIVGDTDARLKLKDAQWLTWHGYGHVANVLRNSFEQDECRSVFIDRDSASLEGS